MATYSILDAARIVGRTKSTVRHHIKKMPPEMVIRDEKEVRLTEEGLGMLRESVNQFTESREPVHEPPVNHDEPDHEPPVNHGEPGHEPVQESGEPYHEPIQENGEPVHDASVNQFTKDREPPVNHLDDMAHIVENLTSERDSLQAENDALKARIEHLEETIRDLRDDRDRWVSMAQNAQRLHDQEQRIHVQDIALLSKRKLLPSAGGNIFDRIKNVFKREQTEGDPEQ